MKLIGMLDSPFVRRVAVTLAARDIPFEHESISVFREMERFGAVNPLFKSPSLVADDGTILMESSVILHWIEGISGVPLLPDDPASRTRAARRVALGLVAAEKAVQIEYERKRPEHERTASWQERIAGQVATAWEAIEDGARRRSRSAGARRHHDRRGLGVRAVRDPGPCPAGALPETVRLCGRRRGAATLQALPGRRIADILCVILGRAKTRGSRSGKALSAPHSSRDGRIKPDHDELE